jgi:hypothetical protein
VQGKEAGMAKIWAWVWGLALLLAGGSVSAATEPQTAPDRVVTVDMHDGTRLVGRVLEEDADHVRLRTLDGVEVEVPRARVLSIRAATESRGKLTRLDPNYSRLLFSPTGRPLRKGDGYFADYELVFPGVSFGVTDHFTLSGGLSTIPGLGLGEQLFYVSPKVGHEFGDRGAVSVGALYATAREEFDEIDLGILYAIGTVGDRRRSLSFGLGLADGDIGEGGGATGIVMLGGTAALSNHVAFVTESWLVLDEGFELGDQPLGLGLRFFSDRVSADVGAILIPSYLDDGGFVPWVSVSYHFGRSRGQASRSPMGVTHGISSRSPRPASR